MRGLSLLGILLANLLIFQYGIFGKDQVSFSSIDEGAYKFTKIFIEGSFMPIFTFLFGYSMIKLTESIRLHGFKVKRFIMRRSLLLIGLGLLHGTFIWEGDILFFYGMMGILLVIFVNRKTNTILVWGLLLFTLMTAVSLVGVGSDEPLDNEFTFQASESYLKEENNVFANGTYSEILDFRQNANPFEDIPEVFLLLVLLLAPIATAPLFLIGMYAARKNIFTKPNEEVRLYKRGMLLILPIALLMKGFGELETTNGWTDFLTLTGGPLVAVGYIFAFAYLYTLFSKSIVMQAFAAVGKLSLTNYLMQSIVCTLIFYGYGLGLFGKLGVFYGLLIGIGIFTIQCVASHFYLRIFKRGPLEVLLRIGTNWSWNGKYRTKKSSPHVDNSNSPISSM